MRPNQRLASVLHPHDPDMAAGESAEQIAVFLEVEIEPGQIEDDGLRSEEARRTHEPGIERREPFVDRLRRFEGESQQRPGSEAHGSSGAHMRVHCTAPLAFR
jgi:hypothetical protein